MPGGSDVALRAATHADAALLLEWRNDADVVRFSLTGRTVGASQHASWLAARLARPTQRLWIAEEGREPVGQVRVDLEDATGTVSIAVAATHRGRGVGTKILRALVIEMEADPEVGTLLAMVHPDNSASLRAFERLGFRARDGRPHGFVVFERSVEAKR
jgi:RimJ/RimL family protein N-acetyltransferase